MNKSMHLFMLTVLLWIINLHGATTTTDSSEPEGDGDPCKTGHLRFHEDTAQTKMVVCPRGGSVEMKCQACGSPKPTIEWHRTNVPDRIKWHEAKNREITNDNTILKIWNCDESDATSYTCAIYHKVPNSRIIMHDFHRFILHLDDSTKLDGSRESQKIFSSNIEPSYSSFWLHLISVSILIAVLLAGFVIYRILQKTRIRLENKTAVKNNFIFA
ncbi:fibroblast growth factor receptor-like 1 [Planococcus citri]|uniref:fibroblast growth factor receptor-like 1 n=1 Tax=Planococcus citri TaxID=170843 RepID=UPI0031F84471